MPSKESEAAGYATTSAIDFYEILAIPTDYVSDSALRKAFRKQSLKWHPDKNPSLEAAEKFHILTTAYDVLSDPTTKAAYDNVRAARLAKKRRSEAFDLNRRKMQEELESRENKAKRQRVGTENEEENFRSQLAKLQEEGAKLRRKREETLRTAAKKAEEQEDKKVPDLKIPTSRFSELDRTVTVTWRRKDGGETINEKDLQNLFGRFGKIQEYIVKTEDKKKKLRHGLIVFESIVGAHTAVLDALKNNAPGFKCFKTVTWASGKKPGLTGVTSPPLQMPLSVPESMGPSMPDVNSTPQSPHRTWVPPSTKHKLNRVPSFASFTNTPKNIQFSNSGVANSSDYENITLMRMREAERSGLEAEIQKEEAQLEADNEGKSQ